MRATSLASRAQELMEKPLDGGEVDLEGFGMIIVGDDHKALVDALAQHMHVALEHAERFRDEHLAFRDAVVANRAVTADSMRLEVAQGQRDLELFRADWKRFNQQLQYVKTIKPSMCVVDTEVHIAHGSRWPGA